MKKFLQTTFYILFPLLIGGIVAFLIRNSIDYSILNKPFLAPPKILFPIAWTIIYILMGVSYYLYKKDYKDITIINIIYYIQSALINVPYLIWIIFATYLTIGIYLLN